MLGHIAWQGAVEPWVGSDLDLTAIGTEASALVEGQRAGMIEAAGMKPESRQRLCPSALQRAVHQQAGGAGANQLRGHAKQHQLAIVLLAEVELQQALV